MKVAYQYKRSTGLERESSHWLAYRYDAEAGFHPDRADFWVGSFDGPWMKNSIYHRFWITDLYQTDSIVWATETAGHVFKNPALGLKEPWEHIRLAGVLQGVWGFADDCVFVWGMRRNKPIAYHWDGVEWREVQTPGFFVRVHGCAPDQVVAVGLDGLIARWDGSTGFVRVDNPAQGTLSDVWMESPDEIYACGHAGGLLAGGAGDWEHVIRHDAELNCVAKWQDQVWVGGMDGLHRLGDGALENVKPAFRPHRFDARGELLITQPTHLIKTEDGANFNGVDLGPFEGCTREYDRMWEK